jgi:hypothetical protein
MFRPIEQFDTDRLITPTTTTLHPSKKCFNALMISMAIIGVSLLFVLILLILNGLGYI